MTTDAAEIADMRAWLADSTWADLTADDIAGITRHYAGGLAQFRADASPLRAYVHAVAANANANATP